jgi:hypothetical protein
LQGSSKFEEVDLTRCLVSRLKSSFWKLQMLGLFMWRCCGLGFLALHKLQFSVEFVSVQVSGSVAAFLLAIEECKGPEESQRLILSHFKLPK